LTPRQETEALATFDEFQYTGICYDDMRPALCGEVLDETSALAGHAHATHLFIKTITDQWSSTANKHGRWYLWIGNLKWINDDLERELLGFACDEAIA